MLKKLDALLVLIVAGFLLAIKIDKPFIGQHDWNGVVYGQQAKNFLRYGIFPLKFGATLATADTPSEERRYSTHYTPVLPILISFSYRLFGVFEWSTRLVPAAASLASIFLVTLLGRELISFRAGIIAGVLMVVTPMFIYYGKNPVHEVVLLPFVLLGFYTYWRWQQSRQAKWWAILFVSLAAAMLIGWSGYYAAGLIAGHGFLTGGKSRGRFLALPALMGGLFLVFLVHVSGLNAGVESELRRAALSRIGGGGFGIMDFAARELRYSINLFTVTLLGLTAIWVAMFLVKMIKRELGADHILLLLIGLFGIFHVAIFQDAGWYHEYLLFPFLPFLALSAAATVERRSSLVILAIVVLTAVERAGYAKALLNSEYVGDVYEEAVKFAKEKKWENEKIPQERDVYFIFYADRENI